MPIIDLIFEAFDGGVSQESLMSAIKAEMTAIARAQMKGELAEPPPTDPDRK